MKTVHLDPPAEAIMAALGDTGFIVASGSDSDGRIVAGARDAAGETWQVWAAVAYAAVCELAGPMWLFGIIRQRGTKRPTLLHLAIIGVPGTPRNIWDS